MRGPCERDPVSNHARRKSYERTTAFPLPSEQVQVFLHGHSVCVCVCFFRFKGLIFIVKLFYPAYLSPEEGRRVRCVWWWDRVESCGVCVCGGGVRM